MYIISLAWCGHKQYVGDGCTLDVSFITLTLIIPCRRAKRNNAGRFLLFDGLMNDDSFLFHDISDGFPLVSDLVAEWNA